MSPRGATAEAGRGESVRATLDREAVLRAALALANEEGIDALTFRRLAEALDVTPMALYRHVSNKSDLLEGVFELVVDDAAVTDHQEEDWRDWVCRSYAKMAEAMIRQQGVMSLITRSETRGPSRNEVIEAIFARLLEAGFDPDQASELQRDLSRYMLGTVALVTLQRGLGRNPDHERHFRAQMELLPSERFPSMTQHASELAHWMSSTEIEQGLRRLIDAFESEMGES